MIQIDETMKIKDILKQPINRTPISAQFIQTKKVDPFKTMLIKPCKLVAEFDEKGKSQIEEWLAFSVIATNMLDVSTKALVRLGVIHKKDAVHDLVRAFGELRGYFKGNINFDQKERELDQFIYLFLTQDEVYQKRIMKFSESILK